MFLYGYRRTSKGRQRSEFPLGSLDWNGQLVLEVRDRTLRQSLKEYFQAPVWECLQPGDEEHFFEAVKRLHRRELFVDLDS